MQELYIPALKGTFGDWTYYSCLVPLKELAERVSYVDDVHENKQLSHWLQRELDGNRSEKIAEYLEKQKERFFNSLVVAVYGGDPEWFAAGRITTRNSQLRLEDIDPKTRESIGFLKLSGNEKLFALDGQHRLAGIKQVIKDSSMIWNEQQSVLLVGHKRTLTGRRRTRRLFTTLNKTAEPVSKNDIIALDEDDVMAITTRRLVEQHKYFQGKRIAFNPDANLKPTDYQSLTSIVNLYDLLQVVFTKTKPKHKPDSLKHYRPSDDDLDVYFKRACEYFELLALQFKPLHQYFTSDNFESIVKKQRNRAGGNVLFRPIGILMMTEVISVLNKNRDLADAVALAATLPQTLSQPPYLNVLWTKRAGMTTNKALARDLLLFMLDELPDKQKETVGRRYARALDHEEHEWESILQSLKS